MRVVVAGGAGEVGSAIAQALARRGHDVVRVSSRAQPDDLSFLTPTEAVPIIHNGDVSLVVNAAGPGDKRGFSGDWRSRSAILAAACRTVGVRSVLLSTTRVMEGYTRDYDESEPPAPLSDYARLNAESEELWRDAAGPSATVLRATNILVAPSSVEAPQAQLLPWSLVTEAMQHGQIHIRSVPQTRRHFVSGDDLARAMEVLFSAESNPPFAATTPATTFTLGELAEFSAVAVSHQLKKAVPIDFGDEIGPVFSCSSGWLSRQGWHSNVTRLALEEIIETWIENGGSR